MPLPERYSNEVVDIEKIWKPEGYFSYQIKIWLAQTEARNELYGKPNVKELEKIRKALKLTPQEVKSLVKAQGHETNQLLRKIQSKLSSELGNYIHKGNTSSDLLDTSLSLQIIDSLKIIRQDFVLLSESLKDIAIKHKNTLQIGRTHGQHAVPQTFGRQVLGWYAEVVRGIERTDRALKVIAYGKCSGEIGTSVFITPEIEELALSKLGLKPDPAPTQIISRDRHAEIVSLMAINGATLNRIATNIRLLSMTGIEEVREPFDAAVQQGSSAMPHKRNSELTERISGLTRRIRSTASEEIDAISSWLERDISHSSTERFTLPDLFGSLVYGIRLTKTVIDGLVVNKEKMLSNIDATYGAIYSSRLLNALLETKKLSRTESYELVKKLAQKAMDEKVHLKKLVAKNKTLTKIVGKELNELFKPEFYLKNIDIAYKRSGIIK